MPEQIAGVSFLVWLACVYALGLVAVGWGFDILAKRTSQRMVAARTFGFTYHEEATRGSARGPVAVGDRIRLG